jgi:LmbE family N-acetylglucosaminyl deacetylase
LVVASSGDKGIHDVNADIAQLISIREAEQTESARILGITDMHFLRHPDAELNQVSNLFEQVVSYIRRARPEVIITHDPMVRVNRQHPDHRAVGQRVLDASFPISAMEQCFPQHITEHELWPWQPDWLLMFGTDLPNYFTDISEYLDVKIHALQAHVSQESAFAGGMAARLRWRAETTGRKYAVPFAEEFLQVRMGPTPPSLAIPGS